MTKAIMRRFDKVWVIMTPDIRANDYARVIAGYEDCAEGRFVSYCTKPDYVNVYVAINVDVDKSGFVDAR